MNRTIDIAIVDDHSLFREGIRFLLSNCSFIGEINEANNGIELLEKYAQWQSDIILMDIEMPDMNGIEASKELLKQYPTTKIIALSMYADECFYTEMIDAGAKGFVLKNSKFEDLQRAIREVFVGNNYFSPEILDSIIKNLNKTSVAPLNSELSAREVEILFNICKGRSNQEIAESLFISKRTVDKHRENILLKSQSRNTAELVVYAIRNGYFDL